MSSFFFTREYIFKILVINVGLATTKRFQEVTNIARHTTSIDFLYRIPIHIPAETIMSWKNDGSVRATYDRAFLYCQKILPGYHPVERFRPRVVIRNRQ